MIVFLIILLAIFALIIAGLSYTLGFRTGCYFTAIHLFQNDLRDIKKSISQFDNARKSHLPVEFLTTGKKVLH